MKRPKNLCAAARIFVASLVLLLSHCGLARAAEEAKVHTSGTVSVNSSIYQIAEEKGFYKENGLKSLTIVATSQVGIQGLVAGSFDFSMILGLGSAAIFRGAPLKIVMSFDSRPVYYLYGSKKIKSVKDLKGGKIIGVSGLGANTDQMTREVLVRNGIDPQRDVIIQGTGIDAVRMAALMGGGLDAAIFNSVYSLTAKKQGLNELLFYGDYDLPIVSGGVVARDKALTENREFVRRFLRGTLKAFLLFRSNENEAVSTIAESFKISRSDALEIYKATLKAYTLDGTIPRERQERIIAFQKKQLKVDREISPESVYDFSILRSLNEELRREGS